MAAQRISTPNAATRATEFVVPIEQGGTGKTTAPEARKALDVPGLSVANTFSGACTFTANQTVVEQIQANVQLSTDGEVVIGPGTIDANLLTGSQAYQLPDKSGTFAMTSDIAGGLSDGDYGDVVVSGSGTAMAVESLHFASDVLTTDTTLTDAMTVVYTVDDGAALTITLPTAVGRDGKLFVIVNRGGTSIAQNIATTSSQTIDGAAPSTIPFNSVMILTSNGANWFTLGQAAVDTSNFALLNTNNDFGGAASFQAYISLIYDGNTGTITNENATGDTTLYLPAGGTGNIALENMKLSYLGGSGNHTFASSECIWNTTSGSPTVTLPTAVGAAGKLYIVKNSGAGTVTLATTSSQTIDGSAPGTVAAGAVARIVSDGSNWFTI